MKTILRPSGEWADTEIKTQCDFIAGTFPKSNQIITNQYLHVSNLYARVDKKIPSYNKKFCDKIVLE